MVVTTNNATNNSFPGIVKGAISGTTPSAGYIGERLTANASAVSFSTGVVKNVTSVSLTAGIWDVSGTTCYSNAGGTNIVGQMLLQITPTSTTISGTAGIDYSDTNSFAGFATFTLNTPLTRIAISSTTTYYLVGVVNFVASTTSASGVISATRVG